jgi:hypothetical protein
MTNVEPVDTTDASASTRVTAYGTKEKETPNAVRFSTEWGVIYVPKTQLAKLDNPERIKVTVESVAD